jgi:hypothetical protein
MPVMFFGGEKAYEELKVRDNEKMKKCLANGIKILYYSNLNMDYPYMVYKTPEEILKLIIK